MYIYINGNHNLSNILEDAVLCYRKLKPNGYFIIEDICNYEDHLFINKIKEWETQYKDCSFTFLKIPITGNDIDNTLLVVFKSAM